jgi:hypothetical protein
MYVNRKMILVETIPGMGEIYMYVNRKMRLVETIPGMGEKYKGE